MKKINNTALLIVFLALILIFILTKLFRSPGRESNMDAAIFEVDTARVTEIRFRPQKDTLIETRLVRDGNKWNVIRKNVEAEAAAYKVENVLSTLASLQPERIVSRKKEKWGEYELTDSSATTVTVFREDDIMLDLKIGKQTGNATYARAGNADEVFVMEGDLKTAFDNPFKEWRNKTFLRLTKNTINRIQFQYPADSSFVLEKKETGWMIGTSIADSARVESYLSKLTFKDHDQFADSFSPSTDADVIVTFSSSDKPDVVIKGWKTSFYQWILNSSVQPKTYFLDEGPLLARDLFVGKTTF